MRKNHARNFMSRTLPPLNGLRAFEATARNLSFTRAAEELSVTQTAISHQIRRLEENLGVRLFFRKNNGIVLTSEGMSYFSRISNIFNEIRVSTDILLDQNTELSISTLISFSSKWLLPRINDFFDVSPNIDLSISSATELIDFKMSGIDVAIRYGFGDWPGMRSDWLMSDDIFPVCSPKILSKLDVYTENEILINNNLLQVKGLTGNDWNMWLNSAGLSLNSNRKKRITYDLAMLAIQSAIDGNGICIGRTTYVQDDLESGKLVAPFKLKVKSDLGFYLVSPFEISNCRKVEKFREWILELTKNRRVN